MIINVTYPRLHCFTGNPIVVKVQADTSDDINLELRVGNEPDVTLTITPYTPDVLSEGSFDISDILDTYFKQAHITAGAIISEVTDFRIQYSVTIEGYAGDAFEGYAYRGGVSNKMYARLADNGYDIFSYRLNSSRRQFLFTTRTNDTEVRLRETEIYPFVFL
ncbi:MAG: hypothetical protein LBS20_10755, partial [Prevotella sp.]|nr:hypothetical protein [Prevotella sp.]